MLVLTRQVALLTLFAGHPPPTPAASSSPSDMPNFIRQLKCNGSAWHPSDLAIMLSRSKRVDMAARSPWGGGQHRPWTGSENNEIIVSPTVWNASMQQQAAAWNASLPRLVEAIFYPTSRNGQCCNDLGRCMKGCGDRERKVHASFLAHHGVTAAEVPLVEMRRDNWQEPFRCDTCA